MANFFLSRQNWQRPDGVYTLSTALEGNISNLLGWALIATSGSCLSYVFSGQKIQPSETEDATGGLYVHGGISWIKPCFTPFSYGGKGEIKNVNLIRKKKSDPIMDTLQLDPHKIPIAQELREEGKADVVLTNVKFLKLWPFVCLKLLNILINIFFLDTIESTTAEEFPSWNTIWDVQYEKFM